MLHSLFLAAWLRHAGFSHLHESSHLLSHGQLGLVATPAFTHPAPSCTPAMWSSWELDAPGSSCSFPKRASLLQAPSFHSTFRAKRTRSPLCTARIQDSAHGRTEFSRELNVHPQQLHRDGESCSKEAGKWGGAGAATSCGQAAGRMGWLQTCSAPSRGKGAPVSSLIAIHYENLKAKIAALS